MPVFSLPENENVFPHPDLAEPQGLLAVGGDLSTARLLKAYSMGIFPWYSSGEPVMWWSPDPRMVLFPKDLKVSKSMRPYFNQRKFRLTADRHFEAVMRNCQQAVRAGQPGTWITEEMVAAYCQLNELGFAHSVEVWQGDVLAGGLYGIALGRIFFGESMFSKVSNASKFGFISLVRTLAARGFTLIDCQQETQHLRSLGAAPISRKAFLKYLIKNQEERWQAQPWYNFFEGQ